MVERYDGRYEVVSSFRGVMIDILLQKVFAQMSIVFLDRIALLLMKVFVLF